MLRAVGFLSCSLQLCRPSHLTPCLGSRSAEGKDWACLMAAPSGSAWGFSRSFRHSPAVTGLRKGQAETLRNQPNYAHVRAWHRPQGSVRGKKKKHSIQPLLTCNFLSPGVSIDCVEDHNEALWRASCKERPWCKAKSQGLIVTQISLEFDYGPGGEDTTGKPHFFLNSFHLLSGINTLESLGYPKRNATEEKGKNLVDTK